MTKQEQGIIDLLWDSLDRVPCRPDRRQTSWGNKTKKGLFACVVRIMSDDFSPPKEKE